MARARMCPHTVTLFNYLGENEDRKAMYSATILYHVHLFDLEGVQGMESTNDHPRMHIFDDQVVAMPSDGTSVYLGAYNLSLLNRLPPESIPQGERAFLSFEEWNGLNETTKKLFWTLSAEGRDYFAKGEVEISNGKLPEGISLFRVKQIGRREMGTKRMWHWKVIAE